MVKEIWKDIIGYEGLYQVSNLSRVKRLSSTVIDTKGIKKTIKEKVLSKFITQGYESVNLYLNGIRKRKNVHRLVAEAFIKKENSLLEVNHKNGIKHDNRIDNLEWITHKENIIHAVDTGLFKDRKGDGSSRRVLSSNQVLYIVELINGGTSVANISKILDVNKSTINGIKYGMKWAHLTGIESKYK